MLYWFTLDWVNYEKFKGHFIKKTGDMHITHQYRVLTHWVLWIQGDWKGPRDKYLDPFSPFLCPFLQLLCFFPSTPQCTIVNKITLLLTSPHRFYPKANLSIKIQLFLRISVFIPELYILQNFDLINVLCICFFSSKETGYFTVKKIYGMLYLKNK